MLPTVSSSAALCPNQLSPTLDEDKPTATLQTKETCMDECVTVSCSSKLKSNNKARAAFREVIRRRTENAKSGQNPDGGLSPVHDTPEDNTEAHIWF